MDSVQVFFSDHPVLEFFGLFGWPMFILAGILYFSRPTK
jgi:hypothetical protein